MKVDKPMLAGLAFLAALAGGGTTFSLWNTDGGSAVGQIVSGDLDLTLVGAADWDETSPDVVAPQQDIDPAAFLARPGDSFRITQDVESTLRGDNMLGRVRVSWQGDAALPAGVTATYTVLSGTTELELRDAGGSVVTDPALGTLVVLPALDADDEGRTDTLTVRVDLAFTDETAHRVGAGSAQVLADLGTIVIDLDQVRTGEGFTS